MRVAKGTQLRLLLRPHLVLVFRLFSDSERRRRHACHGCCNCGTRLLKESPPTRTICQYHARDNVTLLFCGDRGTSSGVPLVEYTQLRIACSLGIIYGPEVCGNLQRMRRQRLHASLQSMPCHGTICCLRPLFWVVILRGQT